jgi:tetratricopeptide (TPR) repeat protein
MTPPQPEPNSLAAVRAIFGAALEQPAHAREAYLDQACAGNAALRAEVAELLRWHENPASALAHPTRIAAPRSSPTQPVQIGRYAILRVLGEGGMGTVYEAEQEQPRRIVALKVMRSGLASPDLVRRFEFEAQVLGRLQHPGIAQVFEAGTTTDDRGRVIPFFAMELVRGTTLLRHATARALDRETRLELMARICDAVGHAHQKGVLHRDLKPGNILVDESGQPKVLDFGIARALDAEAEQVTTLTAAGQIIGTLEYMSPEQLSGDTSDLDTRSDVFALGVILFELLAGRRPFDTGNTPLPEVVRRMHDDAPTRLSSLDKTLRGDVETIVTKALDRDRTRRYASAEALGSDLRRYLRNEPITARPASGWYHLVKFARRNTGLVAGLAVAALLLVLGLIGTSFGMYEAGLARDEEATARRRAQDSERVALTAQAAEADARTKAEAARDRAAKVSRFLSDTFLGVDREVALGRDTTLLKEMMDRAAERITKGELADNAEAELVLRETIGNTYRRIAEFASARKMLEPAVSLAGRVYPDDAMEMAVRLNDLGLLLQEAGEVTAAEPMLKESLAIRQRSFAGDHDQVATGLQNLGILHYSTGNAAEAVRLLEEAVAMRRRLSPQGDFDLAQALAALGGTQVGVKQYAAALPNLRNAMEMYRGAGKGDHPELVAILSNLGAAERETGDLAGASATLRAAVDLSRRLGGDDPFLPSTLAQLGALYDKIGERDQALATMQEALRLAREQHPDGHRLTAALLANVVRLLERNGQAAEAEGALRESIAISRRVAATELPEFAANLKLLARFEQGHGNLERACELLAEAIAITQRVQPGDDPTLARTLFDLGVIQRTRGNLAGAGEALREALAIRRRLAPEGDLGVVEVLNSLGKLRALAGEAEAALAHLREALALSERLFGADHATTTAVRTTIGETLAGLAWAARADAPPQPERLDRTREAVVLLRSVAATVDGQPPHKHTWPARIALGQSLVISATLDADAALAERRSRFAEAETLLTRAHEASSVTDGPAARVTKEQAQQAARWLATLFEQWEALEPGQGRAAIAATWRERSGAGR